MTKNLILAPSSDEPILNGNGDLTQDAWGLQKVSNPHSLFYGMFTFDIPPALWLVNENGVELLDISTSTKAISTNGKAVVKSGVTLDDETILYTRRHPRYQPNRGHLFSCSAFMPNPTSGQVDFGLFNEGENGVFFRRKEDGNLYACIVSNNILTDEDLITVPFDIDLSKGNVYDIQMQWRGVGNINFYIGNHYTGVPELVYTISNLNASTDLTFQNPALSGAIRATNVSGNEGEIHIGCVDITSEAGDIDKEQYAAAFSGNKSVSTGDPIFAIRSPLTISGKINTRDMRLARITVNSDKKSTASLYVTRDTTSIVGGTWTSTGSSSYVELNKTITSIDTAKMQYVSTFNIEANASQNVSNPSRETIEFFLVHGDHLVVMCEDGATAVMSAVIEWGEEI